MTTAIVLAGTRAADRQRDLYPGMKHKALAPIAGQPMIGHVLCCLKAVPDIDHLIVVGDSELAPCLPFDIELRPPSTSPAASLLSVMQALSDQAYPLLVTTADHPLLTPAMVDHFRSHLPPDCAAAVAVARAEDVQAAAPASRRTFWHFADGRYCGCNLFALTQPDAARVAMFWATVERDRKRPWRILEHLGLLALTRFVLGRLTLQVATSMLARRIGLPLAAVVLPFGEAAVDVDRPEDLEIAEGLLARRTKSG